MTLLEQLRAQPGGADALEALLRSLSAEERARLAYDWRIYARPEQLPPAGDAWRTWLVLAGRGWGKTRCGAEFVRAEVEAGRSKRVGVICPTSADGRDVAVLGVSGLMSVFPHGTTVYEPSKRRVSFPAYGAQALLFSGDDVDQVRGHAFDTVWLDELAAIANARDVYDQAQFCLRMGANPRMVITTTPRPLEVLKALLRDPTVAITRGRTAENEKNLAPGFVAAITAAYGSSRLGRQELEGELLLDNPSALWRLDDIDATRVRTAPPLRRTIVGVDPAVSSGASSCETGVVTVGVGDCACKGGRPEKHAFVLGDDSGRMTPVEWARAVTSAYNRHAASKICVEANQGGVLLEENLRANGHANLPIKTIHASKGKMLRAEPCASLYERRMVHHVGVHRRLEDDMCSWNPMEDDGPSDRIDALVHALSALMLHGDASGLTFTRGFASPTRDPRQPGRDFVPGGRFGGDGRR